MILKINQYKNLILKKEYSIIIALFLIFKITKYMETNLKNLVNNVSHKSTREIIEDHVKEIIIDNDKKSTTIHIDRKYALNQLISHEHIWNLIKWVKKTFWEDYETILKTDSHKMKWENLEHHDREMNVPYYIHYN